MNCLLSTGGCRYMRKFSLNSSQIYYYPLDEKREEKGILIYVSSYIAIT